MGDKEKIARFLAEFSAANLRARSKDFDPSNVTDRVVKWLLDKEVLRVQDVRMVFRKWIQTSDDSVARPRLWRMIADAFPERAEEIRAGAARVYAFQEASVTAGDAIAYIQEIFDSWPIESWLQLMELKCLPVGTETVDGAAVRVIIASHDPTHVEVQSVLKKLDLGLYELKYAPEATMSFIVNRVEMIVRASQSDSGRIFASPQVLRSDPQDTVALTPSIGDSGIAH